MKKGVLFALAFILFHAIQSQTLKPYILAAAPTSNLSETKALVKNALVHAQFAILGEYMPANDAARWVIVVSHPQLDKAIAAVGGLTGFAATLRVALTKEGAVVNVSYTNPQYWGNAYFRDDFAKVVVNYNAIDKSFVTALQGLENYKNTPFGSEKGIGANDLREYHYMFGMPYFDETIVLGKFNTHAEAVAKIDKSLRDGAPGLKKVYKYQVPGTSLTLYGIALNGATGEKSFMPTIDISSPKHTAFLPYEVLVKDGHVHMLHGRYRIAVSFPDLTMGTFTKIMSTPGDIEELLKQLVE